MAARPIFEDFDAALAEAAVRPDLVSRDQVEASERAAYEQGYSAGWDDAIRAEEEAQTRISAEFSRNLQDLGFTFHEARTHVMNAMEPLLKELVDTFLPAIAAESLGALILQEIQPLADKSADGPIDLMVPVGTSARLEKLLTDHSAVPVRLVEEQSLGEGQVLLRSGGFEKRIDLDAAISKVADALAALYHTDQRSEAVG